MKNILYCNFLRSLDPKATENLILEDKEPRLFAKYFPKYIKRISFSLKDASVRSKVKRTKIIQEVSSQLSSEREFFVFLDWKMLDWRIFLGNKIKTLKYFSDSSGASHKLHQELRLFSGLKSFSICFPLGSGVDDIYWKKVAKMMNYLQNLKSLSIRNLTNDYQGFLEKLNSSTRLLSSLTEFRIIFKAKGKRDDEWFHNYQSSQLLEFIQSKKSILKHVACLNLNPLSSYSDFTSFQNFADSCPQLETLSFEFSIPRELEGQSLNYLRTLKTFQSLKSLELRIGDLLTCLEYLALPPSIQHLALNFKECLGKEILRKIDIESFQVNDAELSRIFEENPILVKFFDSFKNLKSLDISFREDSDVVTETYQSYFQNCLLKRVPILKKFTSRLTPPDSSGSRWDRALPTFETSDSSLPQFFESLSKTLKTLEIGHEKLRYANFDLSASRGKFTDLLTMKLTGKFDDENLKTLGGLEHLVLLGDSLTKIQLFIHMSHKVESLKFLLECLSKVKMSERLRIEVEVSFLNGKDLEDLKEDFEDEIGWLMGSEQMSLKAKRTSLKVKTNIGSKDMRKFLDVFGERFEKFEIQKRPGSTSLLGGFSNPNFS